MPHACDRLPQQVKSPNALWLSGHRVLPGCLGRDRVFSGRYPTISSTIRGMQFSAGSLMETSTIVDSLVPMS
jgi:hypothetical protein